MSLYGEAAKRETDPQTASLALSAQARELVKYVVLFRGWNT